jgi:phosphoribosyl 1,2-cyclic phosphodiesterase
MSLTVRFWGTRGSIPVPGPQTQRYGGNTTCLEVRTADGGLVILDAGTGLRSLGRSLVKQANGDPIRGDLFFSHAHWDHIQGLPFFTPAFQGGNHFTLWGSPSLEASIDVVVRQQMSPVVFPVQFDELRARMEFRQLMANHHDGTCYRLDTVRVRHPGGALGFRITSCADPSSSMVFIPDNELDIAGDQLDEASPVAQLVEFARGARILIHDAMYTGTEYIAHRGWGHSSFRDAVEFAIRCDVETLVLFHHDPDRDDDELEQQLDLCRLMAKERGSALRIIAAAEGMELSV